MTTPVTTSELFEQMASVIADWQLFIDQQRDWLGGPNSDDDTNADNKGQRLLTDSTGVGRLVDTPAETENKAAKAAVAIEALISQDIDDVLNASNLTAQHLTQIQDIESQLNTLATQMTDASTEATDAKDIAVAKGDAATQAAELVTQLKDQVTELHGQVLTAKNEAEQAELKARAIANRPSTIDAMKSLDTSDLQSGDIIHPKGYYAEGDGGEAFYQLESLADSQRELNAVGFVTAGWGAVQADVYSFVEGLSVGGYIELGHYDFKAGDSVEFKLSGVLRQEYWVSFLSNVTTGDDLMRSFYTEWRNSVNVQVFVDDVEQVSTGGSIPTDGLEHDIKVVFLADSSGDFQIGKSSDNIRGGIRELKITTGGALEYYPLNDGWAENPKLKGNVITDDATEVILGTEYVARLVRTSLMNVRQLGIPCDGTDATDMMQNAIATQTNFYAATDDVIRLRRPSYLRDNMYIDLKGCHIIWDNDGSHVNVNQSRSNGIFNIHGETIETLENVTSSIEAGSDTITCDLSALNLSPGDYVVMDTDNSWATNDGRPHYQCLAKVQSVNGTTSVTFDEIFVWGFEGTIDFTKVTPVFNVTLKNMRITDESSVDRDNSITGIAVMRATNALLTDIHMEGQYNPVIVCYSTRGLTMNRGSGKDAKATDGGEGYFMQVGSSRHVHINGAHLERGRHVVDFTASARCSVRNSHGFDNAETEFSFHGSWEHDIVIQGCTGSVGVAISGVGFGETAHQITIDNVRGEAFFNYGRAYGIHVKDSTFNYISTNTRGTILTNVVTEKYARFGSSESPIDGRKMVCKVYGGEIRSETYSGANFIPETANVEFYGTDVIFKADSSNTNVNCHNLTMFGGHLTYGWRQPISAGTWRFNGTKMADETCFVFDSYVRHGFALIMDGVIHGQIDGNFGLVRNRISSAGIRDEVGDTKLDGVATLMLLNMVLNADSSTDKTIDLDQPGYCLNIRVDGVVNKRGNFICDTRWLTATAGYIDINLIDLENRDQNTSFPDYGSHKHKNQDVDLDTELGVDPHKQFSQKPNDTQIMVYLLNKSTGGSGLLALNYPIDETGRGLLTVTRSAGGAVVKQELIYSQDGSTYGAGTAWVRVASYGTWSDWRQVTA